MNAPGEMMALSGDGRERSRDVNVAFDVTPAFGLDSTDEDKRAMGEFVAELAEEQRARAALSLREGPVPV